METYTESGKFCLLGKSGELWWWCDGEKGEGMVQHMNAVLA
jgi:hypothetical protein